MSKSFPITRNEILAHRPYIAATGPLQGQLVVNRDDREVPCSLKGNAESTSLRRDEWVRIDEAATTAAEKRLTFLRSALDRGLIHDVGDLGTTLSLFETLSEMTDAEQRMEGESLVDKDRQLVGMDGVPIPITAKPFQIGRRAMLATRRGGGSIDITSVDAAGRAVGRTLEKVSLYGGMVSAADGAGNMFRLHGALSHPTRIAMVLSNWYDSTVSNEKVLEDVLMMRDAMATTARRHDELELFIPGDLAWRFDSDYKQYGDRTLMDRVTSISGLEAVRYSDEMKKGDVMLVSMTRDTLDVASAADITTIQWQSPSGWTEHFEVFAGMALRLKPDYDGRLGVVHGSIPQ